MNISTSLPETPIQKAENLQTLQVLQNKLPNKGINIMNMENCKINITINMEKFQQTHHKEISRVDISKDTHSMNESFHKDEDLVAREMRARVRVLCLVVTRKDTYEKNADVVNSTWGARCNTLLFVSNFDVSKESKLRVLNLQPENDKIQPWGLMKTALSFVHEQYLDTHDWVLRTDDTTFVIMENLRLLLSRYNSTKALYLGCRFKKENKEGFMVTGAGYVLSKGALIKAVKKGIKKNMCDFKDDSFEDVSMGKCMESLVVKAEDTRDAHGRGRFLPFPPQQLLLPGAIKSDHWYWKMSYYPAVTGFGCCSDTAISFGGINHKKMRAMNYLIYHLRPYGINTHVSLNINSATSSVIK